ncbi:MAG: putative F420-dependent oxidoreductase, Rv2161c family [Mycobacterium sp.]|nr:putative F420-dependent oxidoreductase, Rv2161c family [Mycobacterium sp.]
MLGFALPQFGESARDDLARFASAAERLGAAGLWVGDRLLAPVDPVVGYAGTGSVPVQFRSGLDPFVALAVAAAVTTAPRLGSSVLVAPWYPPVQLARQLTSIDVVSGGRLVVGLGVGWSPDEYQAAGSPFVRRGAQLDELLDVLDEWWTANPVRHEGERWSVPPSWVDLKPVQRPGPPIYLGASSAAGLARIGRRADGWLPVVQVPGAVRLDVLTRQRQVIDAAATDAGRKPDEIATTVRVNVEALTSVEDVADAVRRLTDNGYIDLFVDMLYVVTGLDAQLEWIDRLLAKS